MGSGNPNMARDVRTRMGKFEIVGPWDRLNLKVRVKKNGQGEEVDLYFLEETGIDRVAFERLYPVGTWINVRYGTDQEDDLVAVVLPEVWR